MLLNFREVSGLRGHDGRAIRPGMIFRGGAVTDPATAARLGGHGVTTVFDLRNRREEAARPSALRELGLRHPLRHHDIDLAAPIRLVRDGAADAESNRAAMLAIYGDFHSVFRPTFEAAFADLVTGEGPVYIHCAVGKDRTGAMTALLLQALGVEREAVYHDYLLSNGAYQEIAASVRVRHPHLASMDDPALRPVLQVEAAYLDAFLDSIGPAKTYLRRKIGLDEAAFAALRRRFLE
ncbi:tyrosine-protein phosphatase [Paracoccus sp. DMF]|uniref:tyrosine-protein phosphatase n=1 Tax=Paracoccus sp. DMF TaxID=400837 RepID=UPI0021E4E34C|nr:tyrosine-protein phosphatase [Paracoccus sp. DMF]MCV2448341.1 tyrosine-protein phosphatase [Paracoccus sp. DMF]